MSLMTQIIMQTSNQFMFQQQQQQFCFDAASSPTSTLSHHDHATTITVATEELEPPPPPPFISDHKSSTPSPSPKGCLGKTIRRRSRASKKTPVTLLNADVKDFRALVQRFTGCRTSEISFASRRGPVNLNFAASLQQQNHHHHHHFSEIIGFHSNHPAYQPAAAARPWGTAESTGEEEEEDPYRSGHTGDHRDMFAMNNYNNNMQEATVEEDFQSLDDLDLKLDDMGTYLHELIGDINYA